jgi:hypothetical protein
MRARKASAMATIAVVLAALLTTLAIGPAAASAKKKPVRIGMKVFAFLSAIDPNAIEAEVSFSNGVYEKTGLSYSAPWP